MQGVKGKDAMHNVPMKQPKATSDSGARQDPRRLRIPLQTQSRKVSFQLRCVATSYGLGLKVKNGSGWRHSDITLGASTILHL